MRRFVPALAFLCIGLLAQLGVAKAAPVMFGQFADRCSGPTCVQISNTDSSVNLDANDIAIEFTIRNLFGAPPEFHIGEPIAAKLSFHATTNNTVDRTDPLWMLGGLSGNFAIVLVTPVLGKDQLLSGTFSNGTLTYGSGGGSAGLNASGNRISPTDVALSSDFFTLPDGLKAFDLDLAFPLDSNGRPLDGSTSNVGGNFTVNTPEPGTLVLLGAGLAGLALCSRKTRQSAR